jgi:excisionase family DNA binding protein
MSAPVPLHKMHTLPARAVTPTPVPQRPRERPAAMQSMLTVEQVAAMMNVSKMTVYRLIHAEELGALQVGRSFRVPEECLANFFAANFTPANG